MPTNSIRHIFILLHSSHSCRWLGCVCTPGYIAKTLSDTLTRETGIQITFESAIVPRWKNGTGACAPIVHAPNNCHKTDRQVSSGVRRSHSIEQGARGARRGGGAAEELREHGSHDPADRRQAFSVVVRGA
jgi:hypothetical protein